MIVGGDELRRTQRGNNNAYNLDTEASWLDWSALGAEAAFHAFARGVLRMRSDHPSLRPSKYFDGKDHDGNGLADVTLLAESGATAGNELLDNGTRRFLALRIDGEESKDSARSMYIAYNWDLAAVDVTCIQLGPGRGGRHASGGGDRQGASQLSPTSGSLRRAGASPPSGPRRCTSPRALSWCSSSADIAPHDRRPAGRRSARQNRPCMVIDRGPGDSATEAPDHSGRRSFCRSAAPVSKRTTYSPGSMDATKRLEATARARLRTPGCPAGE